jgi:hypothetical protein
LTDEEYNKLSNCKKSIGKHSIEDIAIPIEKTIQGGRVSVKIIRHAKAFNDIRFVISLNDNDLTTKINIWDIIKKISIIIGGFEYDKLNGYAIDVLLKRQNKSYTQFGNQIIIPIPFDIISRENLIFLELSHNHDVVINIDFGVKCVGESYLIAKYYDNDNFIYYNNIIQSKSIYYSYQYINIINVIQWHDYSIKDNISNICTFLNFNHVTSDIFFIFTDDETGKIIKNKMFEECILEFEEFDKSIISFISLRHKSNENNCDDGVYWLSLEGIKRDNKEYLKTNKYQKYPNLSNFQEMKLYLNDVTKLSSKFSLSIYAISLNCAMYWLQHNISGMDIMYCN